MRSPYDIMMNERFNTLLNEQRHGHGHGQKEHYHDNNGYHAPPWHPQRSITDENLQNKWCPDCHKLPHMKFPRNM